MVSQTSGEGHNHTSALPLFYKLVLADHYDEKALKALGNISLNKK